MRRTAIWIAILACATTAILLLCWLSSSTPHPSAEEIAAAQDKVYEAVARDMITPANGRTDETSQLVFGDELLTGAAEGKSCPADVIHDLGLERSTPPFNTIADKLYRLFTRWADDHAIRPDAISNFTERYCTGGRLSESFHTDLPRTFIKADWVWFSLLPVKRNHPKLFRTNFDQQFPRAYGIISFSRVGFDSGLHQAIVFTSFECGMLCGTGEIYVLQRGRGGWRVMSRRLVWVS